MGTQRFSLPEAIAQLDRLTLQLLVTNIDALAAVQHRLTADEERVLDYFWDRRTGKSRGPLPEAVVLFLEGEGWHPAMSGSLQARAAAVTQLLTSRDFVTRRFDGQGGKYYELNELGTEYLLRKHPAILGWWESLLMSLKPSTTLAAVMAGLAGSVIGIALLIHH